MSGRGGQQVQKHKAMNSRLCSENTKKFIEPRAGRAGAVRRWKRGDRGREEAGLCQAKAVCATAKSRGAEVRPQSEPRFHSYNRSMFVLVSWGCHNTFLQPGWFKTAEIHVFTVLNATSPNEGVVKAGGSEGESILCPSPSFW